MKQKVLGFIFIFLWIIPCFSISLSVDKLNIDETIKPGQTISGTIAVTNSSNKPIQVTGGFQDYIYDDQKQAVNLKPLGTQKDSCASWIQIANQNITISPKSTHNLQYLIKAPPLEEIAYAQYYAIIYVESFVDQPDLSAGLVLAAKARMSILTKVTIDGKASPGGEVIGTEFIPNKDKEYYEVYYNFKNTGNIMNKVTGSFSIIDADGNLYGRGALSAGNSLPGSTIRMQSIWDGTLDPGEYDLICELNFFPNQTDIQELHFKIEED